jgi:hypothetical protein
MSHVSASVSSGAISIAGYFPSSWFASQHASESSTGIFLLHAMARWAIDG